MAWDGEQSGDPIEILLVEPNSGDARLFAESFKDAKLLNTLHTVSDGESALEFCGHGDAAEGDHSRCPDLILLEPKLSETTGEDVISELNAEPELADVPVVVLTSSEVEEEIVKSRGLEADYYLQKPIGPDEFLEFTRLVEEFWLAIVQQPIVDET